MAAQLAPGSGSKGKNIAGSDAVRWWGQGRMTGEGAVQVLWEPEALRPFSVGRPKATDL